MEYARVGFVGTENHKGWWFSQGLTPNPWGWNDWGIGLRYAGTD